MKDLLINANLEFDDSIDEAYASVSDNPFYSWAKAIITDDQPNLNKQRIPLEEFDNLIRSGKNSPVKMAEEEISIGHAEAMGKPIGVITNLKKVGNQLHAIIALWKRERPKEIEQLKAMAAAGNLPQLSWEIAFEDSVIEEGIEALKGVILNGVAVVGLPAYAGRTAMTAVASVNNDLEGTTLEELDELKAKLSEAETKISEYETKLSEKEAEVTAKAEELAALVSERDSLVAFKQQVEAAEQEKTKFDAIKQKFSDANIEKDEAYFEERKASLLKMSDEELEFLLQELVSFASQIKDTQASLVPDFKGDLAKMSPKEIGKALRETK